MLRLRFTKIFWRNVRFNDEYHENFDFLKRQQIIQKFETIMRIRSNNVQHRHEFKNSNKKRIHVWAIVNYNFKLSLFIYVIFINFNDKMIQTMYLNILKRFNSIKNWLERNNQFVLQKNRDFAHDIDVNNKIRIWKKQHNCSYYFNSINLSNLISIENCWKSLH